MPHLFIFLLFTILSLPVIAGSQDTSPSARAIIEEIEQLYRGDSSRSSITMIVKTPQYERNLKMTGESLGTEYAYFRILSPKKDRGITTLKRDLQMWNFFPRINKVIKVPPSMMMGSWMGSDFTNDDLVRQTELVDAYNLTMEETDQHYEITLKPKEDTITVWGEIVYVIDKSMMLPVSETFYDDRGEKVRHMEFSEPRMFDGKLLPSVLEMKHLHKAGHSTLIVYDEMVFNPFDITENGFSLRRLKSRN